MVPVRIASDDALCEELRILALAGDVLLKGWIHRGADNGGVSTL